MIFIISLKQFLKEKKKLVEPRDYVILDATENESGDLKKFSGLITVDGFSLPSKLLSKKDKEDDAIEIDNNKVLKLEKKFFKGKGFVTASMGAVRALIEANRPFNVFIVLKKKAYKFYANKMAKKIKKLFDVDFEFIYVLDDYDDQKKLLKKDLDQDDIKKLNKRLKRLEKDLKEDD